MDIDANTVRLLGAAQLLVIVAGLFAERPLASGIGSGTMSEALVNISKKQTRMRISNLVALGQSLATIVLGVLYYVVFYQAYTILALVALGFFIAAAITYAVGRIGASALRPLGREFVDVGAPEPSYFQTLGDLLYYGVDRRGYEIYMLFTSLGLLLANYLLYVSRSIPRAISIWGLAAIFLLLMPVLLQLYDRDLFRPAMILAIPYAPY